VSAPGGDWAARAAARVDATAAPLCRLLTVVAAGCLAAMAVLTVADVLGRYLLNRPLPGALELSEFAMALLVFFGLGSTALTGGQVVVDIAIERFPPRLRAGSDAVNALLGTALWALIAWRSSDQAGQVWLTGEVSTILALPAAPFIYAVAFGSAVMALALLGRLLAALARMVAD
jgi:TRAP-type C4-dicarboxylate transport system permease small subunit